MASVALFSTAVFSSNTTAQLLQFKSDPEVLGRQLMAATSRIDIATVKKLVSMGVDVNYRHYKTGVSPIGLAAGRGSLILVKFFVEIGANIESKDKRGSTALHISIVTMNSKIFGYLLSKGAMLDRGYHGLTPLMMAASKGGDGIIRTLIEEKVDINAKQPDGWTALMHAAYNGHLSSIRLLVRSGAIVEVKSNDNKTAMDHAKDRGHANVEEYLRKKKRGQIFTYVFNLLSCSCVAPLTHRI